MVSNVASLMCDSFLLQNYSICLSLVIRSILFYSACCLALMKRVSESQESLFTIGSYGTEVMKVILLTVVYGFEGRAEV